jgi:hypothetical protein
MLREPADLAIERNRIDATLHRALLALEKLAPVDPETDKIYADAAIALRTAIRELRRNRK